MDLGALLSALRSSWKLLLALSVMAVLASIVYLHLAEQKYTITLNVTPVQNDSPSVSGQLGSLATLVGVNLPADSSETDFQLYKRSLRSEVGAAVVVESPDIVRRIFVSDWSDEDSRWIEPRGFGFLFRRVAAFVTGSSRFDWQPPGTGRVVRFLRDELRISDDRDSQLSSVVLFHSDAELAKDLLLTLHFGIDNVLRKRTLDRTNAYIHYLTEKLESTAVAEYRQALAETLSNQEKLLMFASSDAQFTAETFGEIEVSDAPTLPNPVFVIAMSVILGLFLGFIFVIFRTGSSNETSGARDNNQNDFQETL